MNVAEFCSALEEFIAVFSHAVFYLRKIYPEETFRRVRQYDAATYQSNHPGVQEWCASAAHLSVEAIREHECRSVSLVVLNKGVPEDRFVFDVQHLSANLKLKVHPQDVQHQFRAALVALYGSTSFSSSGAGSDDLSLTVVLSGSVPHDPNSPWIVAESRNREPARNSRIRPIRFIEAGQVSLGVYHVPK